MTIPLYGFLEGDTVGLLILAEEKDTLQSLARKLQDAASLRVARGDKVRVVYNDKTALCRNLNNSSINGGFRGGNFSVRSGG